VQGHAHPAIVAAIRARAELGTHFAAVTEDTVAVAEELARRFSLPRWRLVNSGSEATMGAIRIARGLTGRETIMEIVGSYHGHGGVLIFDEVRTGLAIAAGGATERFAVQPDMVTLAKTLSGGLPSSAIGGSEEVMSVVEDGTVYQVGTYNGNPLSMAAARASLE